MTYLSNSFDGDFRYHTSLRSGHIEAIGRKRSNLSASLDEKLGR
jgi:hypothetical protein